MSQAPEVEARTEIRDGMRITWHQPIPMDDGLVLRRRRLSRRSRTAAPR